MNILKNKKASLILKTFGSVVGVASATALLYPVLVQPTPINNKNQLIKNDDLNRSLNENSKQQLTNSEFYFETFTFENPDIAIDPLDATANLAKLTLAKAQWNKIKTNLEAYRQFDKIPSYVYIMQKIKDLDSWSENFIVRESLRAQGQLKIWETIKSTLGWKEFPDVVGTQGELDAKINLLSGFVYGTSSEFRIRSLQNKFAKTVNLVSGVVRPINLVGEYQTVVSIAEIDPKTLQEDIKIDFSYSNNLAGTTRAAQGSLIIRNKTGQIDTGTLTENQNNLEIFGRWTNLQNNQIGDNNFKQMMDNFVLAKTPTGIVRVVVRLKNGDQLNNISVNGRSIDSFGIIDSQISDKLIYDSTTSISNIRFFSTDLNMANIATGDLPAAENKGKNKKYEFYIGNETELNLNLFYKNLTTSEYKELFAFEDDKVSSTIKQMLKIGVVGGAGTNIGTKIVEYSDEVVKDLGVADDFLPNLAFSLKTEKSNNPNIYKQGLYFNDLMAFAIFGSPLPDRTGVKIALGSKITEKIFFEDPGFVPQTPASTEITSSIARKWTNTENEVITKLGEFYGKWAAGNEPIGSTKLGEKFYNKISYEKIDNTFKNITWKNESNDYSGQEMYQSIVDEYAIYQQILKQLIPTGAPQRNIFEVGPGGTAGDIVKNTLLTIDNKAQRTLIINNVKEIIDSTSPLKDLLIEKQLAELVRIKFSEMKTSLTNPINSFYYSEIKKYLDSEVTDKSKIADVNTFLQFDLENGLFNLISSKILETPAELTGSQKMKSLFDLLYFGAKTYPDSATTFFGNSIFSALSTNGGNESILDLFVSFNSNQLVLSDFSSSVSQTQIDSINIYDRLFSIFGFGINEITENSLETGQEIELRWNGTDLSSAVNIIFNKFNSSAVEKVIILEKEYEYNVLNALITSANIYNSLIFRRNNPPQGIESVEADAIKIRNVLEAGITSSRNIFTWSRIQKIGNDIDLYTTYFSKNVSETLKLSEEIKTQADILDRFIEEQDALFKVNPFLNVQIVWPILIGLIAVGMIVVSAIALTGTQRNVKLSSKPVVKTMLIIAILISVAALGVIGGFVVPALF